MTLVQLDLAIDMQKADWIALTVATALLAAAVGLGVESAKQPSESPKRAWLAMLGVASFVAAVGALAYVGGAFRSTVKEVTYQAMHVRERKRVLLKLAPSAPDAPRLESWGCRVVSFDGSWRSSVEHDVALAREGTWETGEVVLRFPRDFVSGDERVPPGRYDVTWTQTRVAEDGTVTDVTITTDRFEWPGEPARRAVGTNPSAAVLLNPPHAEVD